jgi:hypothetical protein
MRMQQTMDLSWAAAQYWVICKVACIQRFASACFDGCGIGAAFVVLHRCLRLPALSCCLWEALARSRSACAVVGQHQYAASRPVHPPAAAPPAHVPSDVSIGARDEGVDTIRRQVDRAIERDPIAAAAVNVVAATPTAKPAAAQSDEAENDPDMPPPHIVAGRLDNGAGMGRSGAVTYKDKLPQADTRRPDANDFPGLGPATQVAVVRSCSSARLERPGSGTASRLAVCLVALLMNPPLLCHLQAAFLSRYSELAASTRTAC